MRVRNQHALLFIGLGIFMMLMAIRDRAPAHSMGSPPVLPDKVAGTPKKLQPLYTKVGPEGEEELREALGNEPKLLRFLELLELGRKMGNDDVAAIRHRVLLTQLRDDPSFQSLLVEAHDRIKDRKLLAAEVAELRGEMRRIGYSKFQ